MNTEVSHIVSCYHCGLDCQEVEINYDDKPFCCEGCKTVYQILHKHQLGAYYEIEKTAGTTFLNNTSKADQYAFLDDATLQAQLIDFEDDRQIKISFSIPQIHCASCIWLLENLYKLHPAIIRSTVNFIKKECYISFLKKDVSLRQVVELLASIGYAPDINLGSLDKEGGTQTDKSLLYKLGIAGFCFGNIMLLSFPEYLGLEDATFAHFFGLLNLLLSLPVVLYSGIDYFKSAYVGLQKRTLNIDVPISLGILAIFSRSVYEIATHTGAGYLDSLSGLVFFLLVGKWFQQKTYAHLSFERDYRSYFPLSATKLFQKEEQNIPVTQLEEGDTILVRHKELIPADAVLMDGNARIDYSFVTGEASPVHKQTGDLIYAGGRQIGSSIILQLVKNVSQSYLTRLWNHESFSKPKQANISALADHIARYFTPMVLVIATLSGAYWLWTSGWAMALQVFTSVLIIACPCALALAAPFTLGNALRIFGKKQFFLKNTAVIEALARVQHLVFDKTGTITESQQLDISYLGPPLQDHEKSLIKSLTGQSTHPISKSIHHSFNGAAIQVVNDYAEHEGAGIEGIINGQYVKIGSANFVQNGGDDFSTSSGNTQSYVAINNTIKGYFELSNHYRKDIKESIRQLGKEFTLSLLSGDNEGEKVRLQTFFPQRASLLFKKSPSEKLQYIEQLQNEGQQVAMLGDGLNDAGALQQADVGIAVTESINHFSPSCDAILEASQLKHLQQFVTFAKYSVRTVKWAFVLSLLYNVVGLSIAVQGLLSPLIAAILMPLSSITIVFFGVGMTNWHARRRL